MTDGQIISLSYEDWTEGQTGNDILFQLDTREDRIRTVVQQLEGCKIEFSHKEKQFSDLQEKFLQSSVHIMEETVK